MAAAYRMLGESAITWLQSRSVTLQLVDVQKWTEVKRFHAPAFDCCKTLCAFYYHMSDLVNQDRMLAKIAEVLPKIEPWKDSPSDFLQLPQKPPLTEEETIAIAKTFQPELDPSSISSLFSGAKSDKTKQKKKTERAKSTLGLVSFACLLHFYSF